MKPKQQIEIQLGHLCNNRCVFCMGGQRTAMRQALPMEAEPIRQQISNAFAEGHRRITLLGGEPTLQPAFVSIVEHCVTLGFEEIVIFTHGSQPAAHAPP